MVSDPADPASAGTGPLSAISSQAGLPTAAPGFPRMAGAAPYIYSYDSDGDPVLIDAGTESQSGRGPGEAGLDGPTALHPPTGGAKSGQACESQGARE